jgi:hypothetical protein
MQVDTTSTADILAVLHIGMLLGEYTDTLPETLPEVNKHIFEIFGISMPHEKNVQEARNKIIAIIERIGGNQVVN